ncbi:hypothetical protein Bca52824_074101 [Brassica carinata]|uniref:Uncharacterized protein n=1 Tax=Brassica carinata TaxID=52824 RepID=A0A8X7QBD1_BRACI|nr:hypothetical protein Bca52824_074101 [Brassica carinata]
MEVAEDLNVPEKRPQVSVAPKDWVRYEVGMECSREISITRAAWIVLDDKDGVLQHSRRAFSKFGSRLKAKL